AIGRVDPAQEPVGRDRLAEALAVDAEDDRGALDQCLRPGDDGERRRRTTGKSYPEVAHAREEDGADDRAADAEPARAAAGDRGAEQPAGAAYREDGPDRGGAEPQNAG